MKQTIFFLTFIVAFTMSVQPLIVMNDIVPAFPEEEQEKIEGAIIEGSILFLEAKSQVALLLKEYEKSAKQGLNHGAALAHVDKAAAALEESRGHYREAAAAGQRAGCVEAKIQELKGFAYDSFAEENGLNRDVMAQVKSYLASGDILGAYRENIAKISGILELLVQIREKLQADGTAEISLVWQLLQRFSEAALFGNYCTIAASAVFNQ